MTMSRFGIIVLQAKGRAVASALAVPLLCAIPALSPQLDPAWAGPEIAADEDILPIPNFSSTQYGWLAVDDELKPMMEGPRPVRADPKHPYFGNQNGTQPTLRVSDLNSPILTDWSRRIMKPANEETIAGKFPYSFQARCTPGGVPGQLLGIFEPLFFVQTRDMVYLIWQRDHVVRRVYMNRAHTGAPKPSWYGESVGHYEGNVLVIDTIGLSPKAPIDNWRTPHSEELHVVERFQLVNGGDVLQAIVTVEDPIALTAPLTVYQRWNRLEGEMVEVACAENNASYMTGVDDPIPASDEPDF
jgi:hypothetical protein